MTAALEVTILEVPIDNRGIPPLAGHCTYAAACQSGYGVDRNVEILKRYNYVAQRRPQRRHGDL